MYGNMLLSITITFGLVRGYKFVCCVEFLIFDFLKRLKAVQKVICAPIIFKNPVKTGFLVKNILFTIYFVKGYFLFGNML